jgi:hypothetical protein
LATPPGASNHETGLALDIAEQAQWRKDLEANHFEWLGNIDRVHFDYTGAGATPHRRSDVLAFQVLWNRNNPKDPIATSGHFDAEVEKRLKRAPAEGFALGPSCRRRRS